MECMENLMTGYNHTWIKKSNWTYNKELVRSNAFVTSIGVPQGSMLGPIWLIIFVNDIKKILAETTDAYIFSYAGDTNLLLRGAYLPDIIEKGKTEWKN